MEHRLDIRSDMRLFPWTFWLFPSSPHLILQVTRTWRPAKKRNSRNSQFLPSYPSRQVHVYSPRPSLHLPWFRQGLLSHWSPSAKKGFGDRSLQAISVTMEMTLLCWSWHPFFQITRMNMHFFLFPCKQFLLAELHFILTFCGSVYVMLLSYGFIGWAFQFLLKCLTAFLH